MTTHIIIIHYIYTLTNISITIKFIYIYRYSKMAQLDLGRDRPSLRSLLSVYTMCIYPKRYFIWSLQTMAVDPSEYIIFEIYNSRTIIYIYIQMFQLSL